MYERFFDDARSAGRHEIRAITWPGNRASIAFHRALGFEIELVEVIPGDEAEAPETAEDAAE